MSLNRPLTICTKFLNAATPIAIAAFKMLHFVAWERVFSLFHAIVQSVFNQENPSSIWFWWCTTGDILSNLLAYSSCPKRLQKEFLSFYFRNVIPLLGPSPRQFLHLHVKPSSYLSDDHTPVEFIWVIEGDGTSSIRLAMEPLSCLDGSPLPRRKCEEMLRSLRNLGCIKSFDSTWSDICQETLVHSPDSPSKMHTSQFFLGADFTPAGMVAKVYYLPKLRAQSGAVSKETLVTQCMTRLGLSEGWNSVLSYMNSLPPASRPSTEMVAVDCVDPSQNRIKVYFRTHDRTLDAIQRHMTLGGALDLEISIQNSLSTLRNLWGFLFPGIGHDQPLPIVQQQHKRDWPGFLIYYEMTLEKPTPFPKVYIPVRQYCDSDTQIADAISRYLLSLNIDIGKHYSAKIKQLFSHRDLDVRTGVHTYIACCWRPLGPQLSLYLSPEVFAPERQK